MIFPKAEQSILFGYLYDKYISRLESLTLSQKQGIIGYIGSQIHLTILDEIYSMLGLGALLM